MAFPYGAVIAATNMMRKNNEEHERKRKPEQKNSDDAKSVRDIIVTYDDGSCRTIKHGVAVEAISDEQIILDYANCTDEQYITILRALIEHGKEIIK